jgi:3-hydroxyisobutyrate dehydrogenase-like beta-hydroxyacid dehydrogenase
MASIAFFGAGLMGGPMAHRLVAAGHRVTVVAHRTRTTIERLVAAGAEEAPTPAAAAGRADVAIAMLPTASEVEAVLFGPSGFSEAMAPRSLVLDMGTSYPPDTRRLAARLGERQGRLVDAPVTGRPAGARAGTLVVMAGGDPADLEEARPILRAMGERIYHFGPVGSGHAAKLIQNMIGIVSLAAMAEGFALAAAADLDVALVYEMLASLPASSPALRHVVPKMFARDFHHVDATIDTVHKDLRQAAALAREYGVPTPTTDGAEALLQAARSLGFGALDFTAVIRGLETRVGREVRPASR